MPRAPRPGRPDPEPDPPSGGMLDALVEGCQVIGPDWTYRYLNNAAAVQGRRTRDELLGRRVMDVYPGIEQTAMFAALRRVMEQRLPHVMENEFRYPDGTSRWFELRMEPVPGGVFVLSLDITEHRQAVQEWLRLSTAIEQAAEAMILTTATGEIQYVNPAFERVSGYRREEVLGRNPRLLNSGKQPPEFYREMWKTLASGRTWRGLLQNRRKDGGHYIQETSVSPVSDDAGRVTGYVGIGRDVTSELRREADRVQSQKMETIGRLAGGVAHDFNNLLSVIIAYADVAMSGLRETDPLYDDIRNIRQAGDRAAALTRQLLAFSRKQVLQPVVLDLNSAVESMAGILQRLIGEHIVLKIALAPDLGRVKADPAQIEQVVMNLVANARDAMPEGGKLTIDTANSDIDEAYAGQHVAMTPGRYAMLSVADSGIGMDEATLNRVFEPFFTTKAAGKGTGLGMATVYGIVKQSGGSIWVYSEPGQGTTFKVYLPLVDEQAETRRNPEEPAGQRAAGETLLIVEDEDAVRRIAERILTNAGYRVLTAGSGAAALAVAEAHRGPIHLLLTDVVMPEMNGSELSIRIAERHPGLRVLYMSGYTDDVIVRHGMLAADTHFIGKPFNSTALCRKVRDVLDA